MAEKGPRWLLSYSNQVICFYAKSEEQHVFLLACHASLSDCFYWNETVNFRRTIFSNWNLKKCQRFWDFHFISHLFGGGGFIVLSNPVCAQAKRRKESLSTDVHLSLPVWVNGRIRVRGRCQCQLIKLKFGSQPLSGRPLFSPSTDQLYNEMKVGRTWIMNAVTYSNPDV